MVRTTDGEYYVRRRYIVPRFPGNTVTQCDLNLEYMS